jgi:hypothetical protein
MIGRLSTRVYTEVCTAVRVSMRQITRFSAFIQARYLCMKNGIAIRIVQPRAILINPTHLQGMTSCTVPLSVQHI